MQVSLQSSAAEVKGRCQLTSKSVTDSWFVINPVQLNLFCISVFLSLKWRQKVIELSDTMCLKCLEPCHHHDYCNDERGRGLGAERHEQDSKVKCRIWIIISPKKTGYHPAHEKILSIVSHEGNANQTHNKIPVHTHWNSQNKIK